MDFPKLAVISSTSPQSQDIFACLKKHFSFYKPENADILIALGGDGFMLHILHQYQHLGIPVYGIHCGSIGFLMNDYHPDDFLDKLQNAQETTIYPLKMTAITESGVTYVDYALNEVSLLRDGSQAAKIQILIDGIPRLEELICDGVMVATPAGSTAYNLSAHGPIIPIGTPLLTLTPISPYRPRRWRGALLPDAVSVELVILEREKRPVNASADHTQVRHITRVHVMQDNTKPYKLLFDPAHNLENRILQEQFLG